MRLIVLFESLIDSEGTLFSPFFMQSYMGQTLGSVLGDKDDKTRSLPSRTI